MKNSYKIILGVAVVATLGAIIVFSKKGKYDTIKRRQQVADEGYEFAYDILYPLKSTRVRG